MSVISRECPRLEIVDVSSCSLLTNDGIAALLLNLQSLRQLLADDLGGLSDLLFHDNPRLESIKQTLKLDRVHLSGAFRVGDRLLEWLVGMAGLSSLHIDGNRSISREGLHKSLKVLQASAFLPSSMKSFSACDVDILRQHRLEEGEAFLRWISLRHGPTLTSLCLDEAFLSDSGAANLATNCPNLGCLSLIGCKGLTEAGVLSFAESCCYLQSLQLGGGVWPDTALRAFKDLKSLLCPQLRELSASGCDKFAGNALRYNHRLEKLSLRGCGGITLSAVQSTMIHCPRLRVVFLPQHIPRSALPVGMYMDDIYVVGM
eukprot:scaffold1239_cov319-Prasinococcus_capsulatus_cf.AAC.7